MKYSIGNLTFIILLGLLLINQQPVSAQKKSFGDATQPIDTRVKQLVAELTLAEKVSLLGYRSKAVPRLGIPAYNWWNEGLHGVARAGEATIFPQAIALAATFNEDLIQSVSNVISTEARAKYNLSVARDRRLQYMGLTFWTPNINIFRDPRWGRGQETYGEDPFLTAHIGTAFVKGLQGTDPAYLKTAAAAKHFVAHSGPEATRDYFDAIVDEKDLRETYLYAFHALVNSGVESIMTAYNRVNGVPNSVNKSLVADVLRKEWGFKGHVVTDCGALDDVFSTHKTIPTAVQAAAAAIKAGIDLDCSSVLQNDVIKAVQQKLLTEKEVDVALGHVLKTQFKLGFFDDAAKSPYYSYGADSVHNTQHIDLARKAAQQSMVLLKNSNNLLPLKENSFSSVMVLGPNAASLDAMVGSYHGVSSKVVNFVEGITAAVDKSTRVEYDMGCDYRDTTHFGGIWGAGNADLTIAVIGLSPVLEGEAGDAFLSENGGDKKNLSLPASEIAFMKALRKGVKKPIIAVITAGSDVDVAAIEPYADAIIFAWYPGEQGGNALADIVLGKVSPSGHLPLTFYNSVNDLPLYTSYSMKDRTYRYFNKPVQYPFGFGLSYTSFAYEAPALPVKSYTQKDTVSVSVNIKNTGNFDGDEVVQAYIKYPNMDRVPVKEMKAFKRISLKKGQDGTVNLKIPLTELQKWNLKTHSWKLYPGSYQLLLGSNSADERIKMPFAVH
ncbi:glycoside hydrolase family 3 protein [Mucilaginibacter glaciei]|uniref:Glycoside hydrolase family 3 C-terminal domain-containing protein n=1 Tax=Mucilaginibacter glaciei TaxID=2772109 RepID=A0A926NWZ6_9SPHI|nr:glycoside hydrolase family 3 protein [Mucilaginibacter glaciei]MBD1393373.1 glycoside hydrolase family 3 C-terminal domain-containing protein [Mucilaginibacter glaciei]